MTVQEFLKGAASVRPTQRQLDWFDTEFYAFVHFSPNTYTGLEWGTGKEDPAIFNPTRFDPDQWVEAVKAAGMKGLVLTAKHHDGFCLWPSRYTDHSIKSSPFQNGQGDIVRDVAAACRWGGLKFGFYLSPWDRNCPLYGTDAYNDYYKGQLTELLTGYGEIFHVWFDGACGEGPDGRKQEYDFPGYIELVRRYQPHATIFYDKGPDVRWCGNEAGVPRHAEWAVVPTELCPLAEVQTGSGPLAEEGDLSWLYNTDQQTGSLSNVLYSKGLCFAPSEIDMSIRPGWFYHPQEEPHSLERLFSTYLTSVGGNACFHLNVPPTPEGLFDPRDVERLRELGDLIRRELGTPIPAKMESVPGCPPTQPQYTLTFDHPQKNIKYLVLAEDLTYGQRIESFRITADFASGGQYALCQGTTVGHKRICQLQDPFAHQNPLLNDTTPEISRLTIQVTAARGEVFFREISAF